MRFPQEVSHPGAKGCASTRVAFPSPVSCAFQWVALSSTEETICTVLAEGCPTLRGRTVCPNSTVPDGVSLNPFPDRSCGEFNVSLKGSAQNRGKCSAILS